MLTAGRLPLFFIGLTLLFAAERYLSAESYLLWLRIGAFALMGIGIASAALLKVSAAKKALFEESRSWNLSLLWKILVVAGAGLFLLYQKILGAGGAPETLAQKALLAGSLLLLLLGFASGVGVEWAIRDGGRGPLAEYPRVRRAWQSWLAVGLLLGFIVSVNYAGSQRDKSWDWSYLKVTSPGESTLKMTATLTEPLQVALFFPQGNEVRPFVESYFKALQAKEPRVQVEFFDKDMNPTTAEKYKVSKNGQAVFELGGKQERIDIGTKIGQARNVLRKLDREFQKSFLILTQQKKTAYFTRGHGEMSWLGSEENTDPFRSIRIVEALLRDLNYGLRFLGAAEGLSKDIPDDASVVVIAGPTGPFLPEEIEALKRYLANGGKLFVFLDIDQPGGKESQVAKLAGEDPLLVMLEGMGIKYNRTPLANEKNFISLTNSKADKSFLFTNIFTSHESMTTLARHEERVALAVFRSGWLSTTPEIGDWQTNETVRSMSDTFNDENKNFEFDQNAKEVRNSYVLGAATVRKTDGSAGASDKSTAEKEVPEKKARMMTFADSSAASDVAMRNPANQVYVADSMKWLVGETKFAGETASEEDVKIQHTRKADVVWFHGTVILVPLLVLGAGAIATRRGKRRGTAAGKGDNA